MISLCNGSVPKRTAVGVFQVIEYLRELAGGTFEDFTDRISIPAVRISVPGISFTQEVYPRDEYCIALEVLDRNEREPKIRLTCGSHGKPDLVLGESRWSLVANPFKDVKRIEEYESLDEDLNVEYLLIKLNFEKMSITFLKWA